MKFTNKATPSSIVRYVALLSLFYFGACSYKKVTGYGRIQKSIDTLQVMPPMLNLVCAGKRESPLSYDTTFMNRIDRHIINTYAGLLSDKYVLQAVPHTQVKPDTSILLKMRICLLRLDRSKKRLKHISLDPQLFQTAGNAGTRYQLYTYVEGAYRSKEAVKRRKGIKTSVILASALISGGTFVIDPLGYSNCTLYLFVFDKEQNKVLLYYESTRYEGDLWEKSNIEALAKTACRKLYYK